MTKFTSKIKKFLKSEDGPTSVEYAIMLALIVAVCLVAIASVGDQTADLMNDSNDKIGTAMGR